MSHYAFNLIRDHSRAKGPAKSVLLMIADYANDAEGLTCFPGVERLARDTGFSERTVRDGIRKGKDLGEIVVLSRGGRYKGRGQANVYQVVEDFHLRQDVPVVDPDHRQDVPVVDPDHRQDVPVKARAQLDHRQAVPRPPAPQDSPSAAHAPPPAALAPQPEVEPEAEEPEGEPFNDSPAGDTEGSSRLRSEFDDWLDDYQQFTGRKAPRDQETPKTLFDNRRGEGFSTDELKEATRRAFDGEPPAQPEHYPPGGSIPNVPIKILDRARCAGLVGRESKELVA